MFADPVERIYLTVIRSKAAMVSAERIFSILDEPKESSGSYFLTKVDYENSAVTIVFKDVVFSYEKEKNILDYFCLEVPRGKTIALEGVSGSGKTTILNLIEKVYEKQKRITTRI